MNDNNKLTKLGDTSGKLSVATAPSFGLRAKIQNAQQQGLTLDNLANAKERIIIVADDSGSMNGVPMQQQKKAIAAFLGVCNPHDTAVGVTPMNKEKITLTLIHPVILSKVSTWPDHGGGGTPTFKTLSIALEQKPSRVVLISDGQPSDGSVIGEDFYDANAKKTIEKFKLASVKIDTVFIGEQYDTSSQNEMRMIAELTGGMYIFFKEGESFAKQFKYLAPAYYAQLTAGTIKI